MGKISKSDQPARIEDAEAARLAEIDARLHDKKRGHNAEGAGWNLVLGPKQRVHMKLHWQEDGSAILVPDDIYEDMIASLR